MLARIALATLLSSGLLAGCAPSQTTFARPPAAATTFDRAASDPKALEIADRVLAAAGGAEKWSAAKQLRWAGSISSGKDAPPVTFEEAWDRWNGRHYSRVHTGKGDLVAMRSVYDTKGTAFAEQGHSRQVIGTGDVERALAAARDRWEQNTTMLFLPFLLHSPGTKLELLGESPVEGGEPLDMLKVTFDPKDTTHTTTYFALVNRKTNQIDRIEFAKIGQEDKPHVGYRTSTFVDVGGMKLATVFENLGASETMTFSQLSASGDPDDTLYVPSVL